MKATKFLLLLLILTPITTTAQLLGGQSVTINSQPTHPEPGKEVTLNLDAYTLDIAGATITWKIDGVEQVAAANQLSMEYTAGALGSTEVITADIELLNGSVYNAKHTVSPSRTNLTIEADTHTPYFYYGRSEPSIGSTIRAISLPETKLGYGPESYIYRWEIDDKVQFGGPIKGRNIVEFAPAFGREIKIRVDVIDPSGGEVVASSLEYIPLIEPEVRFYKESLLRGESHVALGSEYNLIESEISIIAEPFFMGNSDLQSSPRITWQIDGKNTNEASENPYVITLRQTGGSGIANIFFSVHSTESLSQYAENNLSVSF